ncbi:hypothetical protein [Mycolicibacter longobardus]|nr:hypothetical protein [Mycolicibacter longobardus]
MEREGVTLEDVLAQYRKEGLLLSDAPNAENCWLIADDATWDGQIPPLTAEAAQRRQRMNEEFLTTWDGSIGAIIYPDGREVRMDCFETKTLVRLFPDDLLPGEAEIVDIDSLLKLGCSCRMTPGFAYKPFPGVDEADTG